MDIKDRLKQRLSFALSNGDVKEENISIALTETFEIIGDKIVYDYLIVDIAYYRYMLSFAQVNEEETRVYQSNIKAVKNSPYKINEDGNQKCHVVVQNRENDWL
jgi:hypothetical protein